MPRKIFQNTFISWGFHKNVISNTFLMKEKETCSSGEGYLLLRRRRPAPREKETCSSGE
jgi:hypothetical protein